MLEGAPSDLRANFDSSGLPPDQGATSPGWFITTSLSCSERLLNPAIRYSDVRARAATYRGDGREPEVQMPKTGDLNLCPSDSVILCPASPIRHRRLDAQARPRSRHSLRFPRRWSRGTPGHSKIGYRSGAAGLVSGGRQRAPRRPGSPPFHVPAYHIPEFKPLGH